MTVINTNMASVNAQYNLSKVNKAMEETMAALSSGKQVNSAADDAAGLSIITRMESQVRGLNQAMKNAADGQNMIATAEGAMEEITNMLQRMRELSIQASNSTMSDTDRTNLNAEVDQLLSEVDRVVDTTRYNDIKLLDGSFSGNLQIGAKAGETMNFSIGNMSSTALGTTLTGMTSNAMISNSAQGTEAVTTIAQLAFNGNDKYTFDLIVGDDTDTAKTFGISNVAVTANDAEAIATALRTAINTNVNGGSPDFAAGDIEVSANGNVLTIKNNLGAHIKIDNFASLGNGSAAYTSISGDGDSKIIGGAGSANDDVSNTGGRSAVGASNTLQLQEGKDYTFRVNGSLIEVRDLNGSSDGATSMENIRDQLKVAIGEKENVTASDGGGTNTFTLANTDGAAVSITGFTAHSEPAGSKGTMALTVLRDENNSMDSNTFQDGGSDWTYLDGKDQIQLSLTDDTANYSFDLGGVSFTVDRASATTMQAALETTRDAINTAAATVGNDLEGKVSASITDGKLTIENLQNQVTGARGTITSTATDTAEIAGAIDDESVDQNFNDDLDYQIVRNGDSISMSFSQDDADYSFRLTSALGSGALGGDIDVEIKTASANKTLTEALTAAAIEISGNDNITAEVTGSVGTSDLALKITYDNFEGNPTFKNTAGQDLAASTIIGDDGSEDEASLDIWFSEPAADYEFSLGGATYTVTTSDGTGLGDALAAVKDEIDGTTTAGLDIVVTGNTLSITQTGGTITLTGLKSKAEPMRVENFSSSGNVHENGILLDNFTSTAKAAVTAGTVVSGDGVDLIADGGTTVSGTEAIAAESFISVTGDDTYSFTLTGAAAKLITADVEGGSITGLVNTINAQSDATGITASEVDGTVKLVRADGGTMSITNFTSTGSGTFTVAHAGGQGTAETLNDDGSLDTVTTNKAGLASATTMTLSGSDDDKFSFKISDGKSTAIVRPTDWDVDVGTDMLAEINKALSAVGSDITASNTDGVITLTNSSGGAINITEFTSDGTKTMTASPGAGQGVGKILDDTGLSSSASALASVNLTSVEGAQSALSVIDAAMENINSTRSELGAMSNRLDHTINNLGNVVVNTEASQSRIEDADFAKETANLTKNQIMSQAATAMLAQANASKQGVLSLLQG